MASARYPFTPDPAANDLLARDGTALLVGLCLEQQVRTEKAMAGPHELRRRLGRFGAAVIAAAPDDELIAAFRTKPALHRFPAMMAGRVKRLCAIIARDYDSDGALVWQGVRDAAEVYRRMRALPGFGDGKAASAVRILAVFGKRPLAGWEHYGDDADLPWIYVRGRRVEATSQASKPPKGRSTATRGRAARR